MKLSIKEFFSKYAHLLKNFLMDNFIFCAVQNVEAELLPTHYDRNLDKFQETVQNKNKSELTKKQLPT